jgi:hypothetical protein
VNEARTARRERPRLISSSTPTPTSPRLLARRDRAR